MGRAGLSAAARHGPIPRPPESRCAAFENFEHYTLRFYTLFVIRVEERGVMVKEKSDLPQGTLDLLILKVVALAPVHGTVAASVARCGASAAGVAVSGVAPVGEPRAARGGLERDRDGARGEILQADAQGAGAA